MLYSQNHWYEISRFQIYRSEFTKVFIFTSALYLILAVPYYYTGETVGTQYIFLDEDDLKESEEDEDEDDEDDDEDEDEEEDEDDEKEEDDDDDEEEDEDDKYKDDEDSEEDEDEDEAEVGILLIGFSFT